MSSSLLAADGPDKSQGLPRVTISSKRSFQHFMRNGTVATEKTSLTVNTFGNVFGEQEIKINTKTKDLIGLNMNQIHRS